jgi:hypothetical protein
MVIGEVGEAQAHVASMLECYVDSPQTHLGFLLIIGVNSQLNHRVFKG